MEIIFKKATPSDTEYLMQLRSLTMNEHMNNSGVKATEEENLKRVLYKYELASFIYLEGVRVGLLKKEESAEAVEIIQIQLEPAFQGKGLGAKIIQQIIDEAFQKGLYVKLSVLKKNPALKLYQRMGFKIISEDDHEYYMKINTV